MARRLALVMAFVAALALPLTGLAQSVSPDDVAADIDAYWRAQFAERGLSYSPTGVRVVDGSTATGCGLVDPYVIGPAAYCLVDNIIYVSPLWLDGSGQDPTLWYIVLSHEWAHHIQSLLGLDATPTIEAEGQADCLSGAYAADAVDRGFAPRSVYNIGLYLQVLVGDPPFLPDELQTHPTGGERASEFAQGWLKGPSACGVGL